MSKIISIIVVVVISVLIFAVFDVLLQKLINWLCETGSNKDKKGSK